MLDRGFVEFEVENLSAGENTISVVAENAYGMQSGPLKASYQADDGLNLIEGFFASIKSWFAHVAMFLKELFS